MKKVLQRVVNWVKFLPLTSHKSNDTTDLVLEVLNKSNIDVINCRRQSYDNASNITGTYKVMQAETKKIASTQIIVHVLHNH